MKRFLLSAIALVVAFAANAATAVETTTFQGKIAVGAETIPEIGDDSDAATVVFNKMDDGTYQFVLQQFSFGGLVIGDVTITKGLNAEEKDGTIVLTTDNVEAPVTNSEMAAMLGGRQDGCRTQQYSRFPRRRIRRYCQVRVVIIYNWHQLGIYCLCPDFTHLRPLRP